MSPWNRPGDCDGLKATRSMTGSVSQVFRRLAARQNFPRVHRLRGKTEQGSGALRRTFIVSFFFPCHSEILLCWFGLIALIGLTFQRKASMILLVLLLLLFCPALLLSPPGSYLLRQDVMHIRLLIINGVIEQN